MPDHRELAQLDRALRIIELHKQAFGGKPLQLPLTEPQYADYLHEIKLLPENFRLVATEKELCRVPIIVIDPDDPIENKELS